MVCTRAHAGCFPKTIEHSRDHPRTLPRHNRLTGVELQAEQDQARRPGRPGEVNRTFCDFSLTRESFS